MNKKLKLLLVVSLISNGLFAGIILGKISPFGKHPRGLPPHFEKSIGQLPSPLRERLQTAMKQAFDRDQDLRESIDKKRQEVVNVLKAEPFDAMEFQKKNDELFSLMGQAGRSMGRVISDIAQDTPHDQRAEIARVILRGPGGRPPESPPDQDALCRPSHFPWRAAR